MAHPQSAFRRSTRKIFASVFALSLIAAPQALYAQSGASEEAPDEIIVEGFRLPTPAAETGASFSIISDGDLKRRGYQFAFDALGSAPGVTINQNGPFGGLATVSIRGASTDQTLVLLDGVPIGDPTAVGGGFDFSVLDTSQIDRIEILRGPQSTLWGSDAIGGVVNIRTRTPSDGYAASAFAEAGAFATLRGGASLSAGNEAGDFRASFSRISSDGISKADEDDGNTETDAYDGVTAAGRVGVNLPAAWRFEASGYFNQGQTEIDGFPPPNFTLADSPDFSETEQFTATGKLIAPLLDGRFKNTFLAGVTDVTRTGNFGGFETFDEGDRLILRYQGTAKVTDQINIVAGAEREETASNGNETDINSIFGLAEIHPISRLTISGGVRLDDHSTFGSETTGRVAAAWAVTDTITLRGSWGEGFKAPTIFQLTQSFGPLPPNGDLAPETSSAFDAGIDFRSTRIQGSVTYFDRNTDNLIVFTPLSIYENVEESATQGVEAEVNVALFAGLSLSANYTYIDARDTSDDTPLLAIPRHSGDAEISYVRDRFSGSVIVTYNSDEPGGAFTGDVDAFTRVDLAGRYAISDRLELYGRVENVLDADYQFVAGFGTPGISGFGGVRVTLGG